MTDNRLRRRQRRVPVGRRAAVGALAGTLATLPMSAFMLVSAREGWMGEQPPQKVTVAAVKAFAGREPDNKGPQLVLSTLAHLAFGAASGAAFGAVRSSEEGPLDPSLQGMLFGLAVWASAYAGLLPQLSIMPAPGRDQPGRPPTMVASHLIFGSVLGALTARWT